MYNRYFKAFSIGIQGFPLVFFRLVIDSKKPTGLGAKPGLLLVFFMFLRLLPQ